MLKVNPTPKCLSSHCTVAAFLYRFSFVTYTSWSLWVLLGKVKFDTDKIYI